MVVGYGPTMHGKTPPDIPSHGNRRLVPAREAWERLGVSERQFRRICKRGELRTARQGRFVYVDSGELDAYMDRVLSGAVA